MKVIVANDYKFSSNTDEVIRSVYFFCDKISQVQKSIKKNIRHNQYIKTLLTLWFFSK